MCEISVTLKTYPNGNTLMNIEKPTVLIQCGDYITIKSCKYYIQPPCDDSNYRLFTSSNFTIAHFVDVLAQGKHNLSVTSNKLIKSYRESRMRGWYLQLFSDYSM
jgi:hypothetical protein